MGKKLNELAGDGSETHLVQTIRDSAANIWLAGLGAFAKAQEEGGKLFEALVKEGEAVQNRTSKQAQEAIGDVKSKATGTWDKLEQVFVDRVARALHSLDVPTKHDIDALSKRVHELTKVAEKLSAKLDEDSDGGKTGEAAEDASKPATKKASPRAHS
ncbi:phasin family protein [Rhodomicrobium sp. Az07]|uniref:phasin family protein n=1 Tax=Rhodomicrobium sp. Az07 TaxID=2839034 RepID=UPI001BECEF66|nr:phasin family protein [Rhodomicrobium sp. Az07]MBT3069367.1 phasin family protein [Rhodomicrobium sp. Az07]